MNFANRLNEHVEAENPPWRETGIAFINSVTQLLERLLDYRSVMQGKSILYIKINKWNVLFMLTI